MSSNPGSPYSLWIIVPFLCLLLLGLNSSFPGLLRDSPLYMRSTTVKQANKPPQKWMRTVCSTPEQLTDIKIKLKIPQHRKTSFLDLPKKQFLHSLPQLIRNTLLWARCRSVKITFVPNLFISFYWTSSNLFRVCFGTTLVVQNRLVTTIKPDVWWSFILTSDSNASLPPRWHILEMCLSLGAARIHWRLSDFLLRPKGIRKWPSRWDGHHESAPFHK